MADLEVRLQGVRDAGCEYLVTRVWNPSYAGGRTIVSSGMQREGKRIPIPGEWGSCLNIRLALGLKR